MFFSVEKESCIVKSEPVSHPPKPLRKTHSTTEQRDSLSRIHYVIIIAILKYRQYKSFCTRPFQLTKYLATTLFSHMVPAYNRHEMLEICTLVIPFCLSVSSESPGRADLALLLQWTCSWLFVCWKSSHFTININQLPPETVTSSLLIFV